MKIKHLLIGLFAVAAAVACKQDEPVETPKLDVDKTAVSLAATAGEASFNVTSNQSWVATADADWVSLEPASGAASEKAVAVKVTAEDNETTEARKATVTVKAGELTKTVEVNQAAGTGEQPGPGPELPQSEWALVGSFNEWNPASETYLSVLDEEYFVIYGFEMASDTEFKFLKGGAWPPAGQEIGGNGLVEPNTIQPAGGSNIKVTEAGKYDIYLAADLTKFYIMSEGKLPSEATEPAPVENQWGMMGCFVDNQWSSDVPMTKEGEWIVAKGAQFTELTFKIRANSSWADATNIGVAPGSERGVVNGKISVVTAEYSKANLGGDAADIKLNGEAGTYDVYFSFENLEVYVMEQGFKPGEKEPQNPDPVEITYTVVGTLKDINWSNNAPEGLMVKEGDYYVGKNIPLVTAKTLYQGADQIEFKVVETGTWSGYAHAQKENENYINGEIPVVAGGENIIVKGAEGNYDVYFDKENLKVWVMEAGFKPGEKEPVVPAPADYDIDGKQWTFNWEAMGVTAVVDLGVTETGTIIFAYDMGALDPSYEGVWFPLYTGTYTVEKTDGTTGSINATLVDPYYGDELSGVIPYVATAADAVTFDTSAFAAALAETSVSATQATELIVIDYSSEEEGFADGDYWIMSNGKVATPLTGSYGYLQTIDAEGGKSYASNAFTFTCVDATEYLYAIQDSNGKYLYQTGSYNSFNVAETFDTADDGYYWQVMSMGDGTYYIANYNTMKTMQYDSGYGSFGCYGEMVGVYPELVLAEDPIAEPEVPAEPAVATVAEFLAAAESTNVWYKLTGTISGITNTTYGNFNLVDETGTVYVYGLTATQVSSNDKSFSTLGLKEGDIVTLIGTRSSYNGTAQVGGPAYYVSHEAAPEPEVPEGSTVASVTFSEKGFTNSQSVADMEIAIDDNVSVVFSKGGASNDPAYYDSGSAVRMYQNGATMDITATGKTITSIEITFANNHYYVAADSGELSAEASVRTWTGSAESVKFTSTGTDKNHRAYVSAIKVIYE